MAAWGHEGTTEIILAMAGVITPLSRGDRKEEPLTRIRRTALDLGAAAKHCVAFPAPSWALTSPSMK